jgi:hypothetical protein
MRSQYYPISTPDVAYVIRRSSVQAREFIVNRLLRRSTALPRARKPAPA